MSNKNNISSAFLCNSIDITTQKHPIFTSYAIKFLTFKGHARYQRWMIMKQKTIDIQRLRLLKQITLILSLISLLALFTQCKKEATQSDNSLSATPVDGALTQTTPTSNQTALGDETLDQITPTSDETVLVDGTLTQITPTAEPQQIIEEEYGEWLRANPDMFFVPPAVAPSLPLEEQRKQLTEILEERNKRAQDLYETPYYLVAYEFANPLFKEAFPQAHMFAVITNADSTADTPSYTTMVSLEGKNYQMPSGFNQLMVDAGYQLTNETRDTLAHAFIIAGMPTEMAEYPVTCMPGREINKTITSVKLVYEIECVVAYQDIGAVTVLFFPFDNLFRSVSIGWGTLHESGWRNQGFQFGSRGIEP